MRGGAGRKCLEGQGGVLGVVTCLRGRGAVKKLAAYFRTAEVTGRMARLSRHLYPSHGRPFVCLLLFLRVTVGVG
jgi:hypothetical protein